MHLRQQPLREITHGIPYGEEAHDEDGGENQHDILGMNADGVGINYIETCGRTECYEAELLLRPTKGEADGNANDGTDDGNHAPLKQENAGDELVGCAEVAERHHIIFLVNDKHRERADDVKARHHEDESQEDIGDELLYLHDFESVILLLKAVFHDELVAGNLLDFRLHRLEVAAGLEPQFKGRQHALLPE